MGPAFSLFVDQDLGCLFINCLHVRKFCWGQLVYVRGRVWHCSGRCWGCHLSQKTACLVSHGIDGISSLPFISHTQTLQFACMCASFAGASWFMLEAEFGIVQDDAGLVIFHKRLLAWSLMAGLLLFISQAVSV